MLCKLYRIVLYTVRVTAFFIYGVGWGVFSGNGVYLLTLISYTPLRNVAREE